MITEKWVFTFGMYMGQSIKQVPPDYLLSLYYNHIAFGRLKEYIHFNLNKIRKATPEWRLKKFDDLKSQPVTPETVMYFGKYKGYKLKDIPANYLVEEFDMENMYGEINEYVRENIKTLRANQDPNYNKFAKLKKKRPASRIGKYGCCKKCKDGIEKDLSYNHNGLCFKHAHQYDIRQDMLQNKRRNEKRHRKGLRIALQKAEKNPIPEPPNNADTVFFKYLWEKEYTHKSYITNNYYYIFDPRLYTRVLPKKLYPEFEFYERNIVILTPIQKKKWLKKDHTKIDVDPRWTKMIDLEYTLKNSYIGLKVKMKGKTKLERKIMVSELLKNK